MGQPDQHDMPVEKTDVIVIGSGFAGLAAAIEAKEAGAAVVILEKMKGYGGNSVISAGVFAAAGTRMQDIRGIRDSAELMQEDMIRAGLGLNHPDLVRTVAEKSNEVFEWTMNELGIEYEDRVDQFGGHSVPRCYTPPGRTGAVIMKGLLAKAKALGLRIRHRVLLEEILKPAAGRVTGVVVRDGYGYPDAESGEVKRIEARQAVILASGGFGADVDFRQAQDPRLDSNIMTTNKPYATAEGIRAALAVGANPVHLSWIQLGPWTSPDEKMFGVGPDFASFLALPFGMAVDPATGRRFVNELADRKIRTDAILAAGHPCVGLADAENLHISGNTIEKALERKVVHRFDSLEALAGHYGIPVEPFLETVKRFNRDVSAGRDTQWGKPILTGAGPIDHPPFYAVRIWPKVHYTMGGVQIDTEARVIDVRQRVIPGLYAAGEVTGGVHGACRLGCTAIPDCLVFGRIAGRNAGREMR